MAKKKKTKTAAPELISFSELANRAGVSRAAVSMWIKKQESEGIKLTRPSGRRGKLVDAGNPLVTRYIQNTAGKSDRPGQGKNDDDKKSPNTLRKLRYQAEKLRLQNIALRERYVETKGAWEFFDKLLEAEVEIFKGFSDRVLDRIEKELEIKIPAANRKKAKAHMDETIESAHLMNIRIVEDFKKRSASKYVPEKTA